MTGRTLAIRAVVVVVALTAAACTQTVDIARSSGGDASDSATVAAGFSTFPDMPMPAGGEIDVERTLIFGTGEGWFGRLLITTGHATGDMFTFYRESLPGFGWQEVTAVRAAVSVLTYTRDQRVATIQIQARPIRGTEVSITVSPRGTPVAPGPGETAPTGAPATRAPVQSLR